MFAIVSILEHPMWGIVCQDVQLAETEDQAKQVAAERDEHYVEEYGEDYPAEWKDSPHGLVLEGSNGQVNWDIFVKETRELLTTKVVSFNMSCHVTGTIPTR